MGIGDSSPIGTLSIKTGSTVPFYIKNSAGNGRFSFSLTNDDADIFLYDRNNVLQTAMRSEVDSYINGGNVGIGTTTPSQKLEVNGAVIIKETGKKGELIKCISGYYPKGIVELKMNLSEFNNGIYLLLLKSNDNIESIKIIKK